MRAALKAAIYELDQFASGDAEDRTPVLAVHEVKLLERLLTEVRKAEDQGDLDKIDPEIRAELAAEAQTIETQIRSP